MSRYHLNKQMQLVNICETIDKVADIIFVDAEKKIPFSIGDKLLKKILNE